MNLNDIEKLAGHRHLPAWVLKLVADAVEEEREACAKVCEAYIWQALGMEMAGAIRRRGEL